MLEIKNVTKTYNNSYKALDGVNLNVKSGEIFALLGPNGAGKSTLINSICGVVNFDSGNISVDGYDVIKNWRKAKTLIGLVPQELNLEQFEKVIDNINFSRGIHGKAPDNQYIEDLMKELSLFDKKENKLRELSGGMKRRVLIAKALSHQPKILFLDEPTASVDPELRKDFWEVVKRLKQRGITIILTTHYIHEAQELADRVAIINNGKIILVDETSELLKKMGEKKIHIKLNEKINNLPDSLKKLNVEINGNGNLFFRFNSANGHNKIDDVLNFLKNNNYSVKDISTEESSLEEIFIKLVEENRNELSRNL